MQIVDPGLLEELIDPEQLGKRGEAWVVGQFVAIAFVAFPPAQLEVLTSMALLDASNLLTLVGQFYDYKLSLETDLRSNTVLAANMPGLGLV